MSKPKVGKDIEAYCGKCKIDTLHVITSLDDDKIEKVMCKECNAYHKFRAPKQNSEPAKAKAAIAKPKKRRTRRDKWTRLLEKSDSQSATEYIMSENYELATAINHKNFGLGVVKNVIDSRKIEVLFGDGARVLVQNLSV